MNRKALRLVSLLALPALSQLGCDPDLDLARNQTARGTMGEIIFQENCQRVAYTAQVDERKSGQRQRVDVSGDLYRPLCTGVGQAPPDPPRKLVALVAQRSVLAAAVDVILPKPLLDPLEAFLESITVLADNGTMGEVIGSPTGSRTGIIGLLGDMAGDSDLLTALARLGSRSGYRPTKAAAGLASAVLRYPKNDAFLGKLLDLFGEKGKGESELNALLDAVSAEARAAAPVPSQSDKSRTLRLAVDLLFTASSAFGDGTPRPLVLRDWRGLASFATLPAPLVADKDGLPAVDAGGHFVDKDGKPVALPPPFPIAGALDKAPRDALGRLLGQDGKPVYRYLDLDSTLLAGALREATALLQKPEDDNVLGLLYGASTLLGPRVAATRHYTLPKGGSLDLPYKRFASEDGALVDLAHAFVQILGDPSAPETLTATRALFVAHENETSRAVDAMFDANDRGKAHPEAQISAKSTLYDDLIPIIVRTLRVPGLLEDLMDAMTDPHVKGLAPMLARQMVYKDRFALDQSNYNYDFKNHTAGASVTGSWSTPVDRGAPDSDWNRSLMQRMAHLIHDANGLRFCNKKDATVVIGGVEVPGLKFAACDMFKIDDLGLFFVLSMADPSVTTSSFAKSNRLATTYSKVSFLAAIPDSNPIKGLLPDLGVTDTFLATVTGIDGFTRFPSPQAAARSLFIDTAHQSGFLSHSIDPVRCSDGDLFVDAHNDSIFNWEIPLPGNPSGFPKDNFYDAVRPLITAFAKHDECVAMNGGGACMKWQNAAKIFVDLMSTLHVHWGTAQSMYFGHAFQSTDPNDKRYSTGDGVVRYEPLVGEVLGKGDLVPSLIELVGKVNCMRFQGGQVVDNCKDDKGSTPVRSALHATALYLFDPAAAPAELTRRDGSTDARRADGNDAKHHVTPYDLLAEGFAKKRLALAAAQADPQTAPAVAAWNGTTTRVIDQLLTVEDTAGKRRFKNRRFPAITTVMLDFLRARVAAHAAQSDLAAWSHKKLTADIAEMIEGPTFAALADLTSRMADRCASLGESEKAACRKKYETEDAVRTETYRLLAYLVDPAQPSFGTLLTSTGDLLQALLDDLDFVPVAHVAGAALDRSRGVTDAQLHFVQRARAIDPNCPARKAGSPECTLGTVLRNLFQEGPRGTTPISDIADVVSEVHRVQPGRGGDLDAADYRSVIENLRGFLVDEATGFRRFIRIVKGRN